MDFSSFSDVFVNNLLIKWLSQQRALLLMNIPFSINDFVLAFRDTTDDFLPLLRCSLQITQYEWEDVVEFLMFYSWNLQMFRCCSFNIDHKIWVLFIWYKAFNEGSLFLCVFWFNHGFSVLGSTLITNHIINMSFSVD